MNRETLGRAAELLRLQAFNNPLEPSPWEQPTGETVADSAWQIALSLTLSRRPRKGRPWELPKDSPLANPRNCAPLSTGVLATALEALDLSPRFSKTLSALSRWWMTNIENSPEDTRTESRRVDDPSLFSAPPTPRLSDQAIQELRQLPGVSRELVERIRLFVFGESIAPISRATQRVFCRHGWLDPQTEFEEWQTTLSNWSDSSGVSLRQITLWLDELGRDWCGPKPQCEGCPLRELLPAGGPIEPDEC